MGTRDLHIDRRVIKDAAVSGSFAAVLSAAALSYCSRLDEGSAAGGLNGPSQWVWGEKQAYTREPSLKHTGIGYLIHHSTSVFWAMLYEQFLGRKHREVSTARIVTDAAFTSAAAYIVDYKFTPRRFRPGFEKHVSSRSMFAVYVAFAAGLAIGSLLKR